MVAAAVSNSLIGSHFPLLPKLTGTSLKLTKAAPVSVFADWLATMDLTDIGFWLSSASRTLFGKTSAGSEQCFLLPGSR